MRLSLQEDNDSLRAKAVLPLSLTKRAVNRPQNELNRQEVAVNKQPTDTKDIFRESEPTCFSERHRQPYQPVYLL